MKKTFRFFLSGILFVVLFLVCSVCAADIDKAYSFGGPGWTPLVGDWNAGSYSSIGVTNGQMWYLDWNGNGAWDTGTDKAYNFGAPGWTPITIDWNATRKTNIGVTNGQEWYLDMNGDGTFDTGDKVYSFGLPGWLSLVGDWNGDGKTEIGVYKDGSWYLDYNGNGTFDTGDKVYSFGLPGWLSLVGDWNGDGKTEIGVYKDGSWYLDYNGNGAFDSGDSVYSYGQSGWTTVLGDWNGDGKTEIGVYKDGAWYLDYNGNGTFDTTNDKVYSFGLPGWSSVIGDWNGLGKTEIGVYKDGAWYLDYNGDGAWTTSTATTPTAAFTSNVRNGTAPLMVMFSDQSTGTGPLTYAWDFTNDGVIDSTIQSPSFTYATAGTYSVKLTVTNATGSNTALRTGYIIVSPAPVVPTAAFTSDKQAGTAPLTVTFTDQSTGTAPLTYAWDYTNDGVNDSTTQSPSFTYSAAGTYTVRLTAANAAGSNAEIKTSYITVSPAPVAPTAAFTSDNQAGTAPLTVTFTDQSTGTAPLTYAWDFTNNGVNDSTTRNPSFTYSAAGTYTVRLTTTNAAGSDAEIKTGYITVNPVVAPTAAFTSNKQAGTAPLTVTFTDQSTGTAPLTYAWDFTNNGINDSTTRNPSFTYSAAGTYTVRLTTTNAAGSDAEIKTGYITVNPVVAPTAAFTSNKQAGTAPLTVTFTDQSTGTAPLTYAWDFTNDGVNDSTTRNPSFTYSAAGTYTVRLTAANAAGSDAEIKTGYITVSPAPVAPTAAFISDKQAGTAPLTVTFTDQSSGTAPFTYAWDFKNDGTVDSSEPSPMYIYTAPGTFTVKLTVTNGAGSDAELKTGYINVTAVPVAPTAEFVSDKQSGNTPLTVKFTDQSTGTPPLIYYWDFNNDMITDSTIKSPSFIYDTAGTYAVNLTITNSLGSDSELKIGYITVNPTIAPHAAFTSDIQSGDAPLKVKFTDQSTGTTPLTYSWDFNNDGTNDSTTQSPSFTYTTAGTYTVKLTVTNGAGTDVRTEPHYISVTVAPPSSHAGVAITFDDNTVDQWYAIRDILIRNNAHVTFFVSQYEGLDQDQINKLKTLKADGNEIAFHGMYHTDVVEYLNTHSIQQYLDYEIIPGIDLMKNDGLTPVDFAYPYGSDDPAATLALEAYFGHIRDTYYNWDDTIYYQYGSNQAFIKGIGMDESYGHSMTEIYDGISRAKTDDKILIFYGHEPVPSNPGSYQTSYDRLDKILKYVSDNNLKTFTISEIH